MTRHLFYVCPFCHTETGRMVTLDNGYQPTVADLAKRPDMEHIGPGILRPTKRP